MTAGSDSWAHLIARLKGDNVMARIIEFHIPPDFRPQIKWVPQEERKTWSYSQLI